MNKDTVTEMTENFKNMIVVIAKYSTTPDGAGIISSAINKVLEEQQALHPSPSQGQSPGLNGSVWDKGKMKFIPEDVYKLINRTGDGAFGVMTKDWEDYKEGEYFYDNAQQLFGEISESPASNGQSGNVWEGSVPSHFQASASSPVAVDRKDVMKVLISHFKNTELNSKLQDVADDILKECAPVAIREGEKAITVSDEGRNEFSKYLTAEYNDYLKMREGWKKGSPSYEAYDLVIRELWKIGMKYNNRIPAPTQVSDEEIEKAYLTMPDSCKGCGKL